MLKGKKIVIGISAGIAAYKIPLLIRLLKKEGAEVQVVMTPFAKEFVTPLTLSVVSERPVLSDYYVKEDGSWHSHVELGLWADAMLVAPLTANTMAKMAAGIADNFLLTVVLSARCPLFFAPTMDLDMFWHPTVQQNIQKLQALGYHYIEPAKGELASGLKGKGRMKEPEELFQVLKDYFSEEQPFKGKKVMVSAGPTYEPIDPVRFIGNRSSGKMGWAIAKAFARQGAEVELVTGPAELHAAFPGIRTTRVNTAAEMDAACRKIFPETDIAVMAAAVADFTPAETVPEKIKKADAPDVIRLKPTKDILAGLGKMKKPGQILVGFALETQDELTHARQKLEKKNLDMIVLNSLKDQGAGFGIDTNKVTLLTRNRAPETFPVKPKEAVAEDILSAIKKFMGD